MIVLYITAFAICFSAFMVSVNHESPQPLDLVFHIHNYMYGLKFYDRFRFLFHTKNQGFKPIFVGLPLVEVVLHYLYIMSRISVCQSEQVFGLEAIL